MSSPVFSKLMPVALSWHFPIAWPLERYLGRLLEFKVWQISHFCRDDVIKWKHFARYWPFVTDDFPSQRPVTRSFDVFFDLCLNKQLSKQSKRWWFETPSRSLWRHCNGDCWVVCNIASYWIATYQEFTEHPRRYTFYIDVRSWVCMPTPDYHVHVVQYQETDPADTFSWDDHSGGNSISRNGNAGATTLWLRHKTLSDQLTYPDNHLLGPLSLTRIKVYSRMGHG